jgi:hypothetical protein
MAYIITRAEKSVKDANDPVNPVNPVTSEMHRSVDELGERAGRTGWANPVYAGRTAAKKRKVMLGSCSEL